MKLKTRNDYRARRHQRVRRKIEGTSDRPRVSVMVSLKHIYVQFIDDLAGRTLVSVSSKAAGLSKNVPGATELGKMAATQAREKGITTCVFDRGGYRYHGRVKAIADALRESGITL
jgi:large subunit ribosomal protein L18